MLSKLLLLPTFDLPLSLGDLALLLLEINSEESGSYFVGEGEDDGSARNGDAKEEKEKESVLFDLEAIPSRVEGSL